MAGKVLNRIMDVLGLENDYDEDDMEEDTGEESYNCEKDDKNEMEEAEVPFKKRGKVVNINTAVSAKIVILKPVNFDEAITICDNLKNRRIVIVNTTDMEPKIAQRLIDFMGGSSYALGADLEEIESNVYILSPSNVQVSSELKNELSGKGLFNWSK